jgi:peptide/nickel transport system permease protein
MKLLKYILKRIIVSIPVVFGVLTISFFISRLMAGDPVWILLMQSMKREDIAIYNTIMHQIGLDLPLHVQFFNYLTDIFTGNWGTSIAYSRGTGVWDLIMFRLPKTIDLTLISLILASFLGIKIGVVSAKHRNKTRDIIFRTFGIAGSAVPVFVLGMTLQYVFGYLVPIFPLDFYKNTDLLDPPFVTGFYLIDALLVGDFYKILDYLYHLALPVFCLTFATLAGIIRQTRSSMLNTLQQDYIRTARAIGSREKVVIKKHALRNSLIPTVTVIGLKIGPLLAGVVLLESTFALPGMGSLLVDAVFYRDYWVINACMVVLGFIFIFTNLVLDILYGILDPRIKY